MAALRHAAKRILLAGQAPQPICRAAITQEQRCLLPTAIHGRSHAYPRRFSSSQMGESDPDKERVVRVICRTAKAVFNHCGLRICHQSVP
ncbi:hypothetical protein BRADI_1g18635v3 [Brachypodium distachyon]|uniref:Uncharacterized protein n=1 Tax=Brachypodium distachyon TaxID=15368 RepID=A0A0Q3RP81_BRADI|nr:hypothetical protein BRADI_1g18635v3 [Brachypodium distachyon]